ncbi:MAG: hypothetical protein KDJ75_09855, partial [Alphaproteobacteria bacterium]|nr:hypothetical protein [Alphaproteobacteria bacterium]
MTLRFINSTNEKYILHMLLRGGDEQQEIYLEKICSLINKGIILQDRGFGVAVKGLLQSSNKRVRRWAFNAIALMGQRNGRSFVPAVENAVKQSMDDPILLAYAVAALFSVTNDDVQTFKFLNDNGIPVEGALLVASARFSQECAADLSKRKIDIDTADEAVLQNTAILVGVEKVPDGVFSDRHPYKAVIGKLNNHDDKLVQQYSVWAISENPHLTVSDLGIKIIDIESFPPNVKKWLYRLLASDTDNASQNRDILTIGSNDDDVDIRQNLASGLAESYFPELEDIVLPWFADEKDEEIKSLLLEHMATFSGKSNEYENSVMVAYQAAGKESSQRMRLEAAAEQTEIYPKMKRVALQHEATFFSNGNVGGLFMSDNSTTNQFIINGDGNQVSGVTQAKILKDVTIKNVQEIEDTTLREPLAELISTIEKSDAKDDVKAQAYNEINDLAKNPKPERA